jgi:hypothetical protein
MSRQSEKFLIGQSRKLTPFIGKIEIYEDGERCSLGLVDPDREPRSEFALMYAHPDGNNFNFLGAPEMAKRGYRVLAVNHHGGGADIEAWGQPLSRGIGYLRTLAGVQRVVAKIGFVFLMVPLASWLLIAVVVPIAALVSRRTG